MIRFFLAPACALVACTVQPAAPPPTAPTAPSAPRPPTAPAPVPPRRGAHVEAVVTAKVPVSYRGGTYDDKGPYWDAAAGTRLDLVQPITCTTAPLDCTDAPPVVGAGSVTVSPIPGKIVCRAAAAGSERRSSLLVGELPRMHACFDLHTRPVPPAVVASVQRSLQHRGDVKTALAEAVASVPARRSATLWQVSLEGCAEYTVHPHDENPAAHRDCFMAPGGCPKSPTYRGRTGSAALAIRDGGTLYPDLLVPAQLQLTSVALYRNDDPLEHASRATFDQAIAAANANDWPAAYETLARLEAATRSEPDDVRHALRREVAEVNLAVAAMMTGHRAEATAAAARGEAAKARILREPDTYPLADAMANDISGPLQLVHDLDKGYASLTDPCTPAPARKLAR